MVKLFNRHRLCLLLFQSFFSFFFVIRTFHQSSIVGFLFFRKLICNKIITEFFPEYFPENNHIKCRSPDDRFVKVIHLMFFTLAVITPHPRSEYWCKVRAVFCFCISISNAQYVQSSFILVLCYNRTLAHVAVTF